MRTQVCVYIRTHRRTHTLKLGGRRRPTRLDAGLTDAKVLTLVAGPLTWAVAWSLTTAAGTPAAAPLGVRREHLAGTGSRRRMGRAEAVQREGPCSGGMGPAGARE